MKKTKSHMLGKQRISALRLVSYSDIQKSACFTIIPQNSGIFVNINAVNITTVRNINAVINANINEAH